MSEVATEFDDPFVLQDENGVVEQQAVFFMIEEAVLIDPEGIDLKQYIHMRESLGCIDVSYKYHVRNFPVQHRVQHFRINIMSVKQAVQIPDSPVE
jgi:hypothetical protein